MISYTAQYRGDHPLEEIPVSQYGTAWLEPFPQLEGPPGEVEVAYVEWLWIFHPDGATFSICTPRRDLRLLWRNP